MDFGFIFILLFSFINVCRSDTESYPDFYESSDCPSEEICKFLNRHPCKYPPPIGRKPHCGKCIANRREDERGFCVLHKANAGSENSPVTGADEESLVNIEKQIDKYADTNVKTRDAVNSDGKSDEPVKSTPKGEPESTVQPGTHAPAHKQTQGKSNSHIGPKLVLNPGVGDVYFLAIIAACSVAGLIGLVFAGVCWYKLQKNVKAASEVEYPAYGVTGPNKERVVSPDDRKLAQSAQMYHYQRQKQQMIALERANGEMKHDGSEEESDVENEEGDYTVYECPGLAPTGEMEVKNPLFSEDVPPSPPVQDDSGH